MKEVIKNRKFHVDGMTCEGCEATITQSLLRIPGIKNVTADHSKGAVHVKYDLLRVRLEAIEKVITGLGYKPSSGVWDRFKRGWYHFTEENECENMKATHHCCSAGEAEHLAEKHHR